MPPILHSGSSSFLCGGEACPACFPLRPFVGQPIPALLLHQSPVTNHQSRSFPFNFQLSTFLSADGPTLLHFRTQSILSLLVEDSDANRGGKGVVHRWN